MTNVLAPSADKLGKLIRKKFSKEEAPEIYQRGVADSWRAAESAQSGPLFRNVNLNDEPCWHDACECAAHSAQLHDDRERKFVNDIVRWTVHGGSPTEKQSKWLRPIYARIR